MKTESFYQKERKACCAALFVRNAKGGRNVAEIKTVGLVARCVNYKENDRILTILTPDRGKLTVSSRGCRRPKSPLLACSQPFCYGEFVLFLNKERYSLNQCDLRETFYDLRLDVEKLTAASYVMGLCQEVMQEEQSAPALFQLAYYTLSFLCYGTAPLVDLLLCFLLKLLDQMGYAPATTRCGLCGKSTYEKGWLSEQFGGLCAACGAVHGGKRVEPLTLEAMRRMLALPMDQMDKVRLPESVQKDLRFFVPPYAAHHAGLRAGLPDLLTGLVWKEEALR